MGSKCLTDKRDFQERDLTVFGSDVFDGQLQTQEDDEDQNYDIRKEYSYFHQHSKKYNITESDFQKYSKTGDILLYQTNSFGSKLIRTATWSQFDHVAMVVKDMHRYSPSDKVHIFESVQDDGVRITDWESIKGEIGPDRFYNKVVYRSVDFPRSKNQKQLIDFLRQNKGKNYGLNLLPKQRKIGDDGQQEEFFCSELIAQALKMAGVLKQDGVESYKFTPNSFSEKGQSKLNLAPNTKIHREREILMENQTGKYAMMGNNWSSSPESENETQY